MKSEQLIHELTSSRNAISNLIPSICDYQAKLLANDKYDSVTVNQAYQHLWDYANHAGMFLSIAIDHIRENRYDLFRDVQEKLKQLKDDVKTIEMFDTFATILDQISKEVDKALELQTE